VHATATAQLRGTHEGAARHITTMDHPGSTAAAQLRSVHQGVRPTTAMEHQGCAWRSALATCAPADVSPAMVAMDGATSVESAVASAMDMQAVHKRKWCAAGSESAVNGRPEGPTPPASARPTQAGLTPESHRRARVDEKSRALRVDPPLDWTLSVDLTDDEGFDQLVDQLLDPRDRVLDANEVWN